MRAVGIVAEYNPFHTGHAWQIAELRRRLGEGQGVVCVMSGNWVQRGECAVTDKWARAAMALDGGADLVLELPTVWAAASAETFARGAVGILAATGVVDTLAFGCEAGEGETLAAAARCLDSAEYSAALGALLAEGLPFAACRQRAVEALLGREAAACLEQPNNNLAVEYLRALPEGMAALALPRMGVGHHGGAGEGFASASTLRAWLREGEEALAAPYLTTPWRGETASMEHIQRAVLARLRQMGEGDFAALPDSGAAEGLPARLVRAASAAGSLEEVYALAKTKRYAHARIRRLALWAFLGLTAADRPERPPYLRVLGCNERGRAILREMKGRAAAPILTKPAHARGLDGPARALFEAEARCTDLYGLCFASVAPGGGEWRHSPVTK